MSTTTTEEAPRTESPEPEHPASRSESKASRSVTIDDHSVVETAASPPSVHKAGSQQSATASSSSALVDPLRQYQKAMDYMARKNDFVEKELKRREEKERTEATHRPFLSLYVRNADRAPRTVIDVAEANEEWAKQKQQHLQKKRNTLEKELEKECQVVNHVDPRSDELCKMNGHQPIHVKWQEVQKEQEKRREKVAKLMQPTFAPQTYSHLANRRSRSVGAAPEVNTTTLSERSRSVLAERLYKEIELRNARRQRKEEELAEALKAEEESHRAVSIGKAKRTKAEIDEHLELLAEWHHRKEAVQELRRKIHEDDINLTFQPFVSQYSRHLAIASRYHHRVEVAPQVRPPNPHGSKPRNRRLENTKPVNVARCKPLPHAFLVRSDRMIAAKELRTRELQKEHEEMQKRSCTFAPAINPVSEAIMRLTQPPQGAHAAAGGAAGPRFMQPTEAAVRRATPSEDVHVDDSHLYRADYVPPGADHSHAHHAHQQHQQHSYYRIASGDQYDSIPRAGRRATEPVRSPSLRSDVQPSSPVMMAATKRDADLPPSASLDSKFEEMRATLAMWNQLASTASP